MTNMEVETPFIFHSLFIHQNVKWNSSSVAWQWGRLCRWPSLAERRCFRGQRGLARPECAVCSRPLRIWPLRTHHPEDTKLLFTSFSIPSFVEGLPRRSAAPLAAPGLNASPVTGCCQCQFSCYMHSGARPGLHKETSEGLSVSPL